MKVTKHYNNKEI